MFTLQHYQLNSNKYLITIYNKVYFKFKKTGI